MNEDQNLIPKIPVAAASSEAEKLAKAEIAQADDFVQATHQLPAIAEELSGFVKPVAVPEHSLEGTGAVQTPAKLSMVDGSGISLPDGFGTPEAAIAATKGKASEGSTGAGLVYERQIDRKAA
ncbi:MAG: hypothetical protein KBD51_00295 [Candidatus Levybacteria bacterium]|nr:hypothetical protein [Candidatus Levybacteria bacterium]